MDPSGAVLDPSKSTREPAKSVQSFEDPKGSAQGLIKSVDILSASKGSTRASVKPDYTLLADKAFAIALNKESAAPKTPVKAPQVCKAPETPCANINTPSSDEFVTPMMDSTQIVPETSLSRMHVPETSPSEMYIRETSLSRMHVSNTPTRKYIQTGATLFRKHQIDSLETEQFRPSKKLYR